jgi:Domain of Unknown Function (DUF1206)
MSNEAKDKAEDVADSPWTEGLARAGLVAKGITFGIVGGLALKVAFADGKLEDRPGALEAVAQSALGRVLLGALAAGLAGYALWRYVQAVLGRTLETGEKEGVLKRIGVAARGTLYAWLALLCVDLVIDAQQATGGGGKEEDEATAKILDLPLGRWLVAAVGLFILGASAFNLFRGFSRKFRNELKEEQMGSEERRWYSALGVVGHVARAVVFALAGIFVLRAAWQYDPKEAVGIDGALAKLAHAEYGPILLGATAVGLLAYGLFCIVQARYRKV